MAQRAQARQQFPPAEILAPLNGGIDTYTDPTQTKYNRWFAANNCFSGAFEFVQRARFANVITGSSTLISILSVFGNGSAGGQGVIVTTNTNHGFSINQVVNLVGVIVQNSPPINFNGTFTITSVPTSTTFTFTYPNTSVNGISSSGGSCYVGFVPQRNPFTTLRYYAIPALSSYLVGDNNGMLFSFDAGNNYATTQRFNPYIDLQGVGSSQLNGPWGRETLQNILYEMNGQVKQSGRGANAATIEGFGLDTPDSSPQVVISAGAVQNITNIQRTNAIVTVTLGAALTVPGGNGVGMVNVIITVGDTSFSGSFVVISGSGTATLTWAQLGQNTALLTPTGTADTKITKSVGRSYAWAWENANKPHVGAPSPATQFIQYNAQNGAIQLIQQGTVTTTIGSNIVTGVGTLFTSAWIGRRLWMATAGDLGPIASVQSATQLTLLVSPSVHTSGNTFTIFDPQSTHLRLYETADGGATYFRTQRNLFIPSGTSLVAAGLQFFDNANSEPPNFPFTTETSQIYNIPPPIGTFIAEYQGRLVVFGVPGALQSFFYSNSELTSIGMPQESFAPLNQYTLPIQNASIKGWQEMPGSAIIWSDHQDMFRLTGLLSDNTAASAPQLGAQISRLPYNLGIINPFAVDITPLGAIWVTPQLEVWLYTDRYAPRNIGRPIQTVLNTIQSGANIRVKYYHNNTRNWLVIACALNGQTNNNTLLILDLDLLASNGSPSFFVFDMATNSPTWYQYTIPSSGLEVMYENNGVVRLMVAGVDQIQDADFSQGFGTEVAVPNANFLTHAWGNDTAAMIKRPTWMRFKTNRDPASLASDGWSFQALGIDDDFYSFAFPLGVTFTPGVNDTVALGGNLNTPLGSPFRTSPELFRIGAVNFTMGRRIQFKVNFPSAPGVVYQFQQIQMGFGPSPPR